MMSDQNDRTRALLLLDRVFDYRIDRLELHRGFGWIRRGGLHPWGFPGRRGGPLLRERQWCQNSKQNESAERLHTRKLIVKHVSAERNDRSDARGNARPSPLEFLTWSAAIDQVCPKKLITRFFTQ